MKKALMALALLLSAPALLAAQQGPVQFTPMDKDDARIELIKPLMERVLAADSAAVMEMIATFPASPEQRANAQQNARAIMAQFGGGDRYKVESYANGRGRDVVIQLASKADGSPGAFVIMVNGENKIVGFARIQMGGG